MKGYQLCALFFLLLPLMLLPADDAETGFRIHYNLSVVDPERHLADIAVQFENFPDSFAEVGLYPSYNADRFIILADVAAVGNDGNSLPVIRQDSKYRISNGAMKSFTIRYSLAMNQYQDFVGYGPMGFLGETYLLSKAAWTFAVPDGITAEQYSVTFSLPDKWTAVCPWTKSGNRFIETDFLIFIESAFGAGFFDIYERNVAGSRVVIAADKGFDESFHRDLTRNCFSIFEFLQGVFDADVPPYHLSIFAKPTGPKQWQFINESGESQGEALENLNDAYYQYAHRLFHTFNAFYPHGMSVKPAWFSEGVNEYFDALALMNVRAENPLHRLAEIYRKHYVPNRDAFDGILEGLEWQGGDLWEQVDYLAYKKGALVSFLLDKEIRAATDGKRNLAHVLSALYASYGGFQDGPITDSTIRETVEAVSGTKLDRFFDDYVSGKKPLRLESFATDSDRDGISDAGEDFIGTDPERPDTDADSASDSWEFVHGNDPLERNADFSNAVFVDGFDFEWRNLDASIITDIEADSACGTDLTTVRYIVEKDALYVLLSFGCSPVLDPSLRYFVNIDLDFDNIGDLQFAAVYGTAGDTSRFRKDWSNYDMRSMAQIMELESALAEVVEFRIPLEMVNLGGRFQGSLGVWDTKTAVALDSTAWLVFDPIGKVPL